LNRPATQSDIDLIREGSVEGPIKDYVLPCGDKVALYDDNGVWGVGGVVILKEGVGELWFILKKVDMSARAIMKEVSQQVQGYIDKFNLIRAQTVVRSDFKAGIRMMEFLGFEREGLLRKYLPGDFDGFMYARIP